MYGYAGSSASASSVAPFTSPAPMTNPAGQMAQATAVAQTAATSVATKAQAIISAVPAALQGLASPAAVADLPTLTGLGDFLDLGVLDVLSGTNGSIGSTRNIENLSYQLDGGEPDIKIPWGTVQSTPLAVAGLTGSSVGSSTVSASMGRATLVGELSAPQSWATAAPSTNYVAPTLQDSAFSEAMESGPAGQPGVPGMPIGGMGQGGSRFPGPKYGTRLTVMPRPLSVG